jgi:ABC-type phosphate/phosphonate transport system substrate-binding protein
MSTQLNVFRVSRRHPQPQLESMKLRTFAFRLPTSMSSLSIPLSYMEWNDYIHSDPNLIVIILFFFLSISLY